MVRRWLPLALLLVASVTGCEDEPRSPVLAFPGGAAGGGGGTSNGGQAPCPTSLPQQGSACEGTQTCGYPGPPSGCVPQTLSARCIDGTWRISNASANANPALPVCPLTPPAPGTACLATPVSGCKPGSLPCTWLQPECLMPISGRCLEGVWSLSICETFGTGGAGGDGAGGADGAANVGGASGGDES